MSTKLVAKKKLDIVDKILMVQLNCALKNGSRPIPKIITASFF